MRPGDRLLLRGIFGFQKRNSIEVAVPAEETTDV